LFKTLTNLNMKTSTVVIIVVIVIVVIGGIVLLTMSGSGSQSASATATTTQVATTATLNVGSNAQFPSYLTAANGMALYTFKSDTAGVSNCTGTCATEWPPYTVTSGAALTPGANVSGTISTITRADGTTQVTYNGMPLYFFVQDTSAGQATGNGDDGFAIAMPTAGTAPASTTAAPTSAPAAPAAPAPAAPVSSGY
jgi:predicted lipoprotein with Yx(FWY)xxD motif